MKDIILLYDQCCIYEIVILNYFLNFTNSDVLFVSLDQPIIHSMEGYSMNTDAFLKDIPLSEVRSFIVPGGAIKNIDQEIVMQTLQQLNEQKVVLAAICAGVDIFEKSTILDHVQSTHSTDEDCIRDHHIITARANAYVDFAIEVAKTLDLFENEDDLQETIAFWKYYKRMQ